MPYTTTNPCLCGGGIVTPMTPKCPSGQGDCFCFCDIYISGSSDDAVAPCGEQGLVNLLDYTHDFSICDGNGVVFTLHEWDDDFFHSVNITPSGMLEWSILDNPKGFIGSLIFKASCGKYGDYVNVQIGYENLCAFTSCNAGEICDKCNGNCIPDPSLTGGVPTQTASNQVVVQGEEVAYILREGWVLDFVVVESAADQTFSIGTISGTDNVVTDTFLNDTVTKVDASYVAVGGDVVLYINATDARVSFYIR